MCSILSSSQLLVAPCACLKVLTRLRLYFCGCFLEKRVSKSSLQECDNCERLSVLKTDNDEKQGFMATRSNVCDEFHLQYGLKVSRRHMGVRNRSASANLSDF